MVMAPAKTGNDNNSKTAVTAMAHTNKGILSYPKLPLLILAVVANRLIAPNKELTPAKCNDTITRSTAPPL